jgi:hypothetical protein
MSAEAPASKCEAEIAAHQVLLIEAEQLWHV